jgi:hypothetical protein
MCVVRLHQPGLRVAGGSEHEVADFMRGNHPQPSASLLFLGTRIPDVPGDQEGASDAVPLPGREGAAALCESCLAWEPVRWHAVQDRRRAVAPYGTRVLRAAAA